MMSKLGFNNMRQISIKGLNPRYKCYYDGTNLEIYNQKEKKLGSQHLYNSEQTSYCLYCVDGKRRSFYTLRLLYAYTNDISVLDIPKGCIYREKYGLAFYNKRRNPKFKRKPLSETEVKDIKKYLRELDEYWNIVKEAVVSQDLAKVADMLMQTRKDVLRRVRCRVGGAKEVLEDCFQDAIEYYIRRLISPKFRFAITLPQDALTTYTIRRYKTIYKKKEIPLDYDTRRI